MSELTVTIIKLAFLALLWLFILSAVSVMRADLFGTRVGRAREAEAAGGAAALPEAALLKPDRKSRATRVRRGQPTQAVLVSGPGTGTAVRLGEDAVTVGRGAECDLTLEDEYVSTRHAVFRRHDGIWYVEDLGSTNGTFVGGARIHGPTEIRVGSHVRMGKTTLELRT